MIRFFVTMYVDARRGLSEKKIKREVGLCVGMAMADELSELTGVCKIKVKKVKKE